MKTRSVESDVEAAVGTMLPHIERAVAGQSLESVLLALTFVLARALGQGVDGREQLDINLAILDQNVRYLWDARSRPGQALPPRES